MNHKILAAACAAVLTMAAAQASAQDWQGGYFGVSGGYGAVDDNDDEITVFDTNLDGTFGDTVRTVAGADAFSPGFCGGTAKSNNAPAGCEDDDGEGELGIRAGYDFQAGPWVYGAVGEFSTGGGSDSVTAFSITPAKYTFTREIEQLYAARVRLGYAVGRYLPYVTAGGVAAMVENTYSTSNGVNSFTPTENGETAYGFQVGAGIETKVTPNLSLGLEYLYTSLEDDEPLITRIGPGTSPATSPFRVVNTNGTDNLRQDNDFARNVVRITAALRF